MELAGAGTIPLLPSKLRVDQRGYISISMWRRDNSEEDDGFRVYRSTDGPHWVKVADLGPDAERSTDFGLPRNILVWYRVTAWNELGESMHIQMSTLTGFDPLVFTETPINPNPPVPATQAVINYPYDPLDRLAAVDYDDGTFYTYVYDAVGNRTGETALMGTTSSVYDDANRLLDSQTISDALDLNAGLVQVLVDGNQTY